MGKIPVGKVVLLVFYPPKGVAVNGLRRTAANRDFMRGLILAGFCGLVRIVANSKQVSPAGIEPATSP
ncbi:hypothetical protein DMP39_16230 [Klebsiella pneumoniae]|nr:hypothetical protein CDD88_20125 [Klebsiella pneumoniae]PXG24947.1 hypothetical protein DMP53_24060 [Klebsiella pneumoniae]PXG41492.1 hypothetical protein DMP39_16230 [Klebsiella pneumoniae]PXG67604.1 hypothetical protein DMP64_17885 [Klebsiella pneumoniae]PXH09300.1 hypothetical protein DMP67_04290 [Klebsiella pneumoniae]